MTNQLITQIVQTARARNDYVSACTSMSNRMESIRRRLTGMKIEERQKFERKHKDELARFRSGEETIRGVMPEKAIELLTTPELEGSDDQVRGEFHAGNEYLAALQLADVLTMPMQDCHDILTRNRKLYEKELQQLAKQLPVYPWIESVRGVSALSLALIVGETGDLSNYDSPAKVWKRMGMGVVQGKRQRRVAGDAELAIEHGYSPRRAALMWNIGDNFIKQGDEYRAFYLDEKARQWEKEDVKTLMHAHNRARRHTAKRFLVDLWKAWRDVAGAHGARDNHHSHEPDALAAD